MVGLVAQRRRLRPAVAAVLMAATLGACATPTPYQPASGRGFSRAGYSDEQIEDARFRVSFSGNSLTSREVVERYLLYRAAQLTLERGYDHFILVDRDTERQTQTYTTGNFFGGYGGFYGGGLWGPSWRYFGRGYGWRYYDPFFAGGFGGGFGPGFDVRSVDRYEAIAEIVVGRGPKPADNVRAFDARQVVERLGSKIRVPEPR